MPREGDLTNGHSSHAVTKSYISYWFEDTYLAGFFFILASLKLNCMRVIKQPHPTPAPPKYTGSLCSRDEVACTSPVAKPFEVRHAHITRFGQQWGLQVEALMSQHSLPFTPEPAKGQREHMTRWSLH